MYQGKKCIQRMHQLEIPDNTNLQEQVEILYWSMYGTCPSNDWKSTGLHKEKTALLQDNSILSNSVAKQVHSNNLAQTILGSEE
jgi:hypothetical protein